MSTKFLIESARSICLISLTTNCQFYFRWSIFKYLHWFLTDPGWSFHFSKEIGRYRVRTLFLHLLPILSDLIIFFLIGFLSSTRWIRHAKKCQWEKRKYLVNWIPFLDSTKCICLKRVFFFVFFTYSYGEYHRFWLTSIGTSTSTSHWWRIFTREELSR